MPAAFMPTSVLKQISKQQNKGLSDQDGPTTDGESDAGGKDLSVAGHSKNKITGNREFSTLVLWFHIG